MRLILYVTAAALLASAAYAAPDPASARQPVVAAGPVAGPDLIETARASGRFTILLRALDAANLTETIRANPGLTLLAPTDAAFAALPAGELERLMQPGNAPLLQKILAYHLLNTTVSGGHIKDHRGTVLTVEGSSIVFDGSGPRLKADAANIVQADIPARNGTLHAIDKVLFPADLPQASAMATTDVPPAMAAAPSAADAAVNVAAREPVKPR